MHCSTDLQFQLDLQGLRQSRCGRIKNIQQNPVVSVEAVELIVGVGELVIRFQESCIIKWWGGY